MEAHNWVETWSGGFSLHAADLDLAFGSQKGLETFMRLCLTHIALANQNLSTFEPAD